MYALIENNSFRRWVDLRSEYPNTSFPSPLTPDDMPEGYVIVGDSTPPTPNVNEKVVLGTPVQQGHQWVQGWDVVPMTSEEIQAQYDAKAADVRQERNQRLLGSDWTQGKDIPDTVSAPWAAYRQALRDVTVQVGFPYDVQWPQPL